MGGSGGRDGTQKRGVNNSLLLYKFRYSSFPSDCLLRTKFGYPDRKFSLLVMHAIQTYPTVALQ